MDYPLVLIEWEDSCQPSSAWRYVDDLDSPAVTRCKSIGWLVQDANGVKVLAQTLGAIDGEEGVMACGVVRIPERSIIRKINLDDPHHA